ncbi:MAG: nuclear transport factor 2 family protein [Ideonella sp.]|nr:nuclear transport factor 2 family protein [Ideonella sp.]
MRSPEAIVQAQVEAYNRQDMAAFLDSFHADAEFIRWPHEVLFKGHDAFRQRYDELWARAPQLRAEINQRIVVGRFVTDLEQLVGHPDGARAPLQVLYETEGGRIRRFWVIQADS